MSVPARQIYEFGPFRLNVNKRLLLKGDATVPLTSKAFDTLLALIENSGEVLEKDSLLNRVWPDTIVEEKNLTIAISTLRKALGETPSEHQFIVTVPGRGYKFVATVREFVGEDTDLIVEKRTTEQITIEEDEPQEAHAEALAVTNRRPLLTAAPHSRWRWFTTPKLILPHSLLLAAQAAIGYFQRSRRASPPAQPSTALGSLAVLAVQRWPTARVVQELG